MDDTVTLGLIGGTGLTRVEGPVEELDIDTPYGRPSAPIRVLYEGSVKLLFLPRHGDPHVHPPHAVNYRANIWALREAGANQVLAVSAVGGIGDDYAPGTLVASDQLIDFTWGRKHTFHDSAEVPLVHVDFSWPYEGPLRRELLLTAADTGIALVDGGCIAVFQGPRLETAGEIEMARRAGCDMAGMTSLPEASLAREAGLDYAGLAVVSNWAAGVNNDYICEDDIAETLREPMTRAQKLLSALARRLGE